MRSLAFAFASCQRWDEGYYSAYRRLAEEDVAFVVHRGDYLYENGIDEHGGFRNVPVPEQRRRHHLRAYYGPMVPANPHIKFFDGDPATSAACWTASDGGPTCARSPR